MSEPADSLSIPSGYVRIDLPADPPRGAREAWHKASTGRTVITGEPGDGDDAAPEYEAHNCDEMGCGWDHVLEIREPAPGDSTGARCAVHAVEAGPVEDIDGACYACGEPATCHGRYEGHGSVQFACDECCGHGCEDGWCEPVDTDANAGDSDFTDTLPAVDACAS
jgi:hypothetical protein